MLTPLQMMRTKTIGDQLDKFLSNRSILVDEEKVKLMGRRLEGASKAASYIPNISANELIILIATLRT